MHGAGSTSVLMIPTGKNQRDQNKGGSKTGKRRCSSPSWAWRNQFVAAGGVEFGIKKEGKRGRARLLRGARDPQHKGDFQEVSGDLGGPTAGSCRGSTKSRMMALEVHPKCLGEDTNLGLAQRNLCCHQGDTLLRDVAGTSSVMPPARGPWGHAG